ncbi:MAG: tetratricopeptide repeat protein [Cyclobacteriaceae bacterium]|nr:tetratricopeptide repeat protein [Cyclobacteriaceae bacterium]MCK5368155.1 tetratricopeptide repeat protein [Cyclobacteriaceae bacterium]
MKTIATIIIVLGFGSLALGQNSTKVYESFIESYGLEATGNYSNAIDKIIDIYAEDSYDMNIRLGWLYYNLGNYPESEKYYQRSMEILPYSIEAKLGYVLPVSGLGYWDKVIEVYYDILKIDPQNTLVNYRMGGIYYERKEYEKAYDFLEMVINLYPNDFDAVLLYAWTHYQMGKLKEAKVLFNKALLIKPNNASAQYGLGLIK